MLQDQRSFKNNLKFDIETFLHFLIFRKKYLFPFPVLVQVQKYNFPFFKRLILNESSDSLWNKLDLLQNHIFRYLTKRYIVTHYI